MPDRLVRGLLDTSVLVDLGRIDPALLPVDVSISALSLAELTVGALATDDATERARRQDRLQRVEALFDPLPFDAEAARSFGAVYTAVVAQGRQARGRRMVDLLIAATALSHGLPLVTRNPDDLAGLTGVVDVIAV